MEKYVCDACGYIYDPAKGDKAGDMSPGIAFENLPATWVCPLCGADQESFVK